MLRRIVHGAGVGLWLGALAGSITALSDYGAHWLWLDRWGDRAALLLVLLGVEISVGALLGFSVGVALGATEATVARVAQGWRFGGALATARGLRDATLAAPGLATVATLLFTGGTMSRLPGRPLWECLTVVLVIGASFGVTRGLHALELGTRGRFGRRARLALAALGSALLVTKLNQWILPTLYDYLHGALAIGAVLTLMVAGLLALTARASSRALPRLGSPAALALGITLVVLAFGATLDRLDRNQNVRVALLHPNMPHARAALQALAPLVLEPAQRRATRAARTLSEHARAETSSASASSGPTLPDAHVLLVTIDALRADHLGLYGYTRETSPELDRMARDSVVFERAYAPAPHSSFSLCSLMTSEYLHETVELGSALPSETLASTLTRAGYHTAAFYTDGIFHTEGERLSRYADTALGFALHDAVQYPAEALTDRVVAEIDRTVARGEPSTLFWVHYFDVHEPYRDTHFGTSDLDRYDSEIRHVDAQLERLVQQARQRLKRDVIVVITADHGEEFLEHGGVYHGSSLYEEQVRVPLLVSARGLSPRRVHAPVSSLDIAPTLLRMLGLTVPGSMRGSDVRALLTAERDAHAPVFSAVNHRKMVIDFPHKLIADLRFGAFELYDLSRDPHERTNLADADARRVVAMRNRVYEWLDGLAQPSDDAAARAQSALDWGRLGDRRAVLPLAQLLTNHAANAELRAHAAYSLGRLDDARAVPNLAESLTDADPRVRAAAAIALGNMRDRRAQQPLRRIVASEEPVLRMNAALALGRLDDRSAVPGLIEALWLTQDDDERKDAVRSLGRIGDERALEPLIALLPATRTRYLVPLAIGVLHDRRGFSAIRDVLASDPHPDVQAAAIDGLGYLGDPRAIPLLLPIARGDSPNASRAGDALVRLGAIARGVIGGVELTNAAGLSAEVERCETPCPLDEREAERRADCVLRPGHATLAAKIPSAIAGSSSGAIATLAVRRDDAATATHIALKLGDQTLGSFEADASWREYSFPIPPQALAASIRVELVSNNPDARLRIAHLLVLPPPGAQVARADRTKH